MRVSGTRSCGHVRTRCVGGELVPVCGAALGDDKAKRIRNNELDCLFINGFNMATDLKTGLRAELCCVLRQLPQREYGRFPGSPRCSQ